jgi:hypothetical protein
MQLRLYGPVGLDPGNDAAGTLADPGGTENGPTSSSISVGCQHLKISVSSSYFIRNIIISFSLSSLELFKNLYI